MILENVWCRTLCERENRDRERSMQTQKFHVVLTVSEGDDSLPCRSYVIISSVNVAIAQGDAAR